MKKSLIERLRYRVVHALARRGLLRKTNLSILNQKVSVPIVDGEFCTLSEPFMLDILEKVLPAKPGAFIDVGVNLGQTLTKVKSIDKSRRYIGFEPNPICVYYCEKLISANNFSHCDIIPAGISDQNGLIMLNHYSVSRVDSSASIIPDFRPDKNVARRSIVPVCEYSQITELNLLNDVSIVKIDVEGAELEVLKSIKGILSEIRPTILIEILPPYTADNTQRVARLKSIEKMLSQINYCIYRVEKNSNGSFAALKFLSEFGIYDKVEMSDFIFVPVAEREFLESIFNKI